MIHLFNGYYMAADKSSYTVGKAEESRSKRFFKPGARYYPTLRKSYDISYAYAFRRDVKHIPKDYTRWNY